MQHGLRRGGVHTRSTSAASLGEKGRRARTEGRSVPNISAAPSRAAIRSSARSTPSSTRPKPLAFTFAPAPNKSKTTGSPAFVMPRRSMTSPAGRRPSASATGASAAASA